MYCFITTLPAGAVRPEFHTCACKLDLPRKTSSQVTTARLAQANGAGQPSYGTVIEF